MRKKSHISLAQFIVKNSDSLELNQHKKAFYLGSILPDCKPSFLTEKHQFNGTFEKVQGYIRDLTENCVFEERDQRSYWRRVGEVVHYIADYFTFPHNEIYPGNLKDHCMYEKELKLYLREYLNSEEAMEKHRSAGQKTICLADLFLHNKTEKKPLYFVRQTQNVYFTMNKIML